MRKLINTNNPLNGHSLDQYIKIYIYIYIFLIGYNNYIKILFIYE